MNKTNPPPPQPHVGNHLLAPGYEATEHTLVRIFSAFSASDAQI